MNMVLKLDNEKDSGADFSIKMRSQKTVILVKAVKTNLLNEL